MIVTFSITAEVPKGMDLSELTVHGLTTLIPAGEIRPLHDVPKVEVRS